MKDCGISGMSTKEKFSWNKMSNSEVRTNYAGDDVSPLHGMAFKAFWLKIRDTTK